MINNIIYLFFSETDLIEEARKYIVAETILSDKVKAADAINEVRDGNVRPEVQNEDEKKGDGAVFAEVHLGDSNGESETIDGGAVGGVQLDFEHKRE